MVVVGHRGLGEFTGLLLGFVGAQTAAHAASPVIVVRTNAVDRSPGSDEAGQGAGQVVVGVDGSDLSRLAVDYAFTHAALHGAGVLAVNVFTPPVIAAPGQAWPVADDASVLPDQTRLLSEALAGYGATHPDVPVRHKVVIGEPAEVLVAESAGAALTVLSSRCQSGSIDRLLGSTSQAVLHHATGPVALIRAYPTRFRPEAPDAAGATP
jgi:nucleotide-binding universal stress UspA family protein